MNDVALVGFQNGTVEEVLDGLGPPGPVSRLALLLYAARFDPSAVICWHVADSGDVTDEETG